MNHFKRAGFGSLILAGAICGDATAAVKALSRANCLGWINESITYERPQFRNFQGSAASRHVPQGNVDPKHVLGAPNNGHLAWRFRAGDQSDPERMTVYGYHTWILQGRVFTQSTAAVNCELTEW
ncbi:hypothetical protein [Stenotrophomonas sp.]|uniref:hypothetical protein n=1 Tax=Stenotrophomonas sp. TaxID=69392 RepID=UPI0028A28241|nr:hypothetical protein [Stenotrophomonas sp.]